MAFDYQTRDFRPLGQLLLGAQGSVLNVFPWWKTPANAHSLSQKSSSPFLKRNEWPERMVRLVCQGSRRQIEVVSSHETY